MRGRTPQYKSLGNSDLGRLNSKEEFAMGEFLSKYADADLFDLMEKGFKNMTRLSIETLQEEEIEKNNEILPEEKDDCWSY